MKNDKITIAWFRKNLRLKNNSLLQKLSEKGKTVLPIYIFDARQYKTTQLGFEKTGFFKTRFLFESLKDLKRQLHEQESDMLVRVGYPEVIMEKLLEEYDVESIWTNDLPGTEENTTVELVEDMASAKGVSLQKVWDYTLIHPDELEKPISQIKDTYTPFGRMARSSLPENISEEVICPKFLQFKDSFMPDYGQLGVQDLTGTVKSLWKGGESAAWEYVKSYVWKDEHISHYADTRNGLLGTTFSSHLSPYLAEGCLSAENVYHEVLKYKETHGQDKSIKSFVSELLWRDFFQFQLVKHQKQFFRKEGILHRDYKWKDDEKLFFRWANAETGVPFIDANMKELNQTGYMSNRGRQNAASFLIKDMGINWLWGAAYFESKLIDYDPASNYGNWAYIAGVGNDKREDRYFNVLWQAEHYDPKGNYTRHWLPQLSFLEGKEIHRLPFHKDRRAQANYPEPVVLPDAWDELIA